MTHPNSPSASPARALPLDPNKLDTERIAAYQVAAPEPNPFFLCGFIDGNQGMRTQRMLKAFQTSRGLLVTGFLDQPTRDAIGEPGEPFFSITLSPRRISIRSYPSRPPGGEKARSRALGYNDIWELLAEKISLHRALYLKGLNPGVTTIRNRHGGHRSEGFSRRADPPDAASLRIILSETSIEALDANGQIIAFFPCSIAADKNKRPNGALTVKSVVPNPDYTFDPALFADAAAREGITKKMVLPPGTPAIRSAPFGSA